MTKNTWNIKAASLLKTELRRAGMTYDVLAQLLGDETEGSIKNKLNRGTFQAAFLFAALSALGRKTINLDDL